MKRPEERISSTWEKKLSFTVNRSRNLMRRFRQSQWRWKRSSWCTNKRRKRLKNWNLPKILKNLITQCKTAKAAWLKARVKVKVSKFYTSTYLSSCLKKQNSNTTSKKHHDLIISWFIVIFISRSVLYPSVPSILILLTISLIKGLKSTLYITTDEVPCWPF